MWQWPWQKQPAPIRPPKVGGTRVPDQVLRIDFSRPHDFHFRFFSGSECILQSCVLEGFTTPVDDAGNQLGSGREWGHDRWLVLRKPDGRRVYVPRDGLQYIEETEHASPPA